MMIAPPIENGRMNIESSTVGTISAQKGYDVG
jgi:hypothetical protein